MEEQARPLRLAVLGRQVMDESTMDRLRKQGLEVVFQGLIGETLPLDLAHAEVLLVELGVHVDRSYLTGMLEKTRLPVFLYESELQQGVDWNRDLVRRLHRLVGRQGSGLMPATPGSSDASSPLVVVLCGSVGGPKAISEFFQHLPGDLPVTFLLVQHMAEEFQDMLSAQLRRFTDADVAVLERDQELQPGEVWIVPADRQISIDQQHVVKRLASGWETVNRPSMDIVLEMVASVYGTDCGAIVFSGIGNDGLSGCEVVAGQGGFVWAQTAESCVVPRLPDALRETGCVETNGSPEELAAALYKRCLTHFQASC